MNVQEYVSQEYESVDADAPVATLVGKFGDPTLKTIVVTDDGEYVGVVTRRQLATSHHSPREKAGSLVRQVPRVTPTENVRRVSRLLLGSQARALPVFQGEDLRGVVTVDGILQAVESFLDVVAVEDVCSTDLVTVAPDATAGAVFHRFRESRITHLPVVEDDEAVGILSLHDVLPLTTRVVDKSQGGSAPGFDGHGGVATQRGYRSHGGFGARGGERQRLLDLPIRDLMSSPVWTVRPDQSLDEAVSEMFDKNVSSLVVTTNGSPFGIVTKTDVLRALTWGADERRPVQIYGTSLIDDISYEEIVRIVDRLDAIDRSMSILDARVHLHEHDERLRGTPLLLARLRLHTDRGLFVATAEGYGASHAIHEVRDVMERRIRERKTYDRSKKHPDRQFWERRYGWSLEGARG
jgi:CBS domain-containing protein